MPRPPVGCGVSARGLRKTPDPAARLRCDASGVRPIHLLRYVVPALVCAAGIVVVVASGGRSYGPDALSALFGAGGAIYLINALLRMGGDGEAQRDYEETHRLFLDRYGSWPDEVPEGWRSSDGLDVHEALRALYDERYGRDERLAA
jgi:hypothetical protein